MFLQFLVMFREHIYIIYNQRMNITMFNACNMLYIYIIYYNTYTLW